MATTKKTATTEEVATTEATATTEEVATTEATATTKEVATTEATATTKKDDRVEVYIPKGAANDDPNLFVGVNGVNYILPRGKKSMVPPHIKAEIDRSFAAQNTMDERVDELLQKANQPLPGASV